MTQAMTLMNLLPVWHKIQGTEKQLIKRYDDSLQEVPEVTKQSFLHDLITGVLPNWKFWYPLIRILGKTST